MSEKRYHCATADNAELCVRRSNTGEEIVVMQIADKYGRSLIWLNIADAVALRKQLKKLIKGMENG